MKQQWQFGLHAVQALLKTSPQRVQELQLLKGRRDERIQKVLQLAERNNIPVNWVARNVLDNLTEGNHQGVAARCTEGEVYNENFLIKQIQEGDTTPFYLVLDGVTDPHNLGACLRSAEAAGVHAVIAPKDKSVGITPVVSKVACGAAETLPYIMVTNLARTLKEMQQLGVWIVGTAGEAEQMIYDTDLKGPLAIVMGAEGKGLRRLTRDNCDTLAKLPMAGQVSSLNVSVASGICLFEAVRQRSAN